VRSLIARYVLFALSFRYLMSAHHDFTFEDSPIGISWNAIGSSLVFLLGLVLIRTRHLLLTTLLPFYAVIAVVVLSAFANQLLGSSVDVVQFGYLIVITIAVYDRQRARRRRAEPAAVGDDDAGVLPVPVVLAQPVRGRGAGVRLRRRL
jgi:hypothetical protein